MTSIRALTSASHQALEQEGCFSTAAGLKLFPWSDKLSCVSPSCWEMFAGALICKTHHARDFRGVLCSVSTASLGKDLLLPRRYELLEPGVDQMGKLRGFSSPP